jgi:hypothetical protein
MPYLVDIVIAVVVVAVLATMAIALYRDPTMFYPNRPLTPGQRRWNQGVAIGILAVLLLGGTVAAAQLVS